ncbi:ankyrin repeat domain-containing protein [Candidatus Mesenet endosymbiont of Agriotes lineatus]|uniref:ankyrin repeat domain-containing protein n=1 Tax=Candidatus Mesenet endosymbiont of Agriotes lineatus TaxID=3077948 RepID=UPI0030D4BDDA
MSLDDELINAVKKCCINGEEYKKNIEEVRSLLEKGASANAVDNWFHKLTVLLWAAEQGKKEVVELLLKHGADINNGGEKGKPTATPLHGAIENKHEEAAIFLIEKSANIHAKDQHGSTPLHAAACEGLGNLVKLLLDKGVNVHIQNIHKYTPLHRAMYPNADPQTVRLLLEHGSDINTIGNCGSTLISSYTIWTKPLESFFLLLLFGADVNKESECDRNQINTEPYLKSCLAAFEEIEAMPNLSRLVKTYRNQDKKENAKVIASYINSKANGQELIEEFKTIKEKYSSDEQLSFIPECVLGFIEYITLKFLKFHTNNKKAIKLLLESKDGIKVTKAVLVDSKVTGKTKDECVKLPNEIIQEISSYLNLNELNFDNVLLALSKKADVFLNKLKNIYEVPSAALAEPQPEAASVQSKNIA